MKREKAWVKYRRRALIAERQLSGIREAFEQVTGMPFEHWLLLEGSKLYVSSPRTNFRITGIKIPDKP